MEQNLKICRCCGRELPLNHFKKTRYGGYVSVCTECSTKKLRENKQKRIEEQKQKVDDVRAENRQLCLADFSPRELMAELKRRGYEGKITYVETHTIDLSAL
jgi:ribosome-binding protein aMBF1 (putative translation factor)